MAENYTLNIDVNTSKAVKSVDNLDDAIKDTSKNTQDLEGSMSGLDSASGGMITKFKGLKSGLKNVITGF
jgi:phage-related tail protein